ncbi:MAG: Ig-like domain-containing protein [Cytophagales bacterium]|nr:Ig-like domain-containing protein [Cytophagales bacterium]
MAVFGFSISPFITYSQITNRIYALGNSVTDGINYAGFQTIANQKGNTHLFGRHMIPGTPLSLLYSSSSSGFAEAPYSYWPNAFANYDWDCISFQPFDRSITGSDGDFTTIQNWVNYIKSNRSNTSQLQIYIYSRYPRVPSGYTNTSAETNASMWNSLWAGTYGAGSQSNETKQFFINLLNTVRGANMLAKQAAMIPAGDVMHAMNIKMAAGRLPGYTDIWDFYSDGIHVNNMGSFLLGATFFATMYKQDPRGLTVPTQYGSIAANVRDTILQTIYEVVFTHPYSGTSLADIVAPTGISVTPKSNVLSFLQSYVLTATIAPANASNKNVTWSSSSVSVAQVDSKGKVTGVGAGIATITGVTNIGGFTDFAVVTVSGLANYTSVTGILSGWDYPSNVQQRTVVGTSFLNGVSSVPSSRMSTIGDGLYVSNFDAFTGSNQNARELSIALSGDDYLSFKLAPAATKLLNVTEFSFRVSSQNRSRVFTLMSNIKGFNTSSAIASLTVSGGMQNITVTEHTNISVPVEFRLYMHYAGPDPFDPTYESAGIGGGSGNDVQISGSVVTPTDNEKPSSVTGIAASQITESSFFLSWNEATDNMIVMGYNVYKNGTKLNTNLLTQTSLSVTSLTSGAISNISVTAVDFVGNESTASTLQVISNRPPTAVLNIDKTFGAAPLTINVNANGSTDPDVASGDLVLGFDYNFGDGSPILNANSGSYTYTAPGVYTVSLVVVDTRNMRSTSVSQVITVTAFVPDNTPPSLPANVRIVTVTSDLIYIMWDASTDNVSLAGYSLSINGASIDSTTVTSYTFTGLAANTAFTISISSYDAAGNGSTASNITATTLGTNTNITVTGFIYDNINNVVFPNPSPDGIFYMMNSDSYEVYDFTGKLVQLSEQFSNVINLSEKVPSGLYLLKTKSGHIYKIIIK